MTGMFESDDYNPFTQPNEAAARMLWRWIQEARDEKLEKELEHQQEQATLSQDEPA